MPAQEEPNLRFDNIIWRAAHSAITASKRYRQGAAITSFLTFFAVSFATEANLLGGQEPLAPELAFIPSVTSVDGERVIVEFAIEPGYYLYRDKLSFGSGEAVLRKQNTSLLNPIEPAANTVDASIVLTNAVFSDALTVSDDYFGEQAVFRNTAVITLPYTATLDVASFKLSIKYQGCADIGLCYPPTTTSLLVEVPPRQAHLPISSANRADNVNSDSLDDLLNVDKAGGELLPPELAYLPQIDAATSNQIDVRWFIEDGYYLYRDKLSFALQQADGLQVANAMVSEGIDQFDDFFGQVKILRESAQASLELSGQTASSTSLDATLIINYQGCADIGVCFPPSVTELPVNFAPVKVAAVVTSGDNGDFVDSAKPPQSRLTALTPADETPATAQMPAQSEQDRLFGLLGSSNLWVTIATFFGLGLLLAFTPCVLPMVPILSSLIVGQGKSMSAFRAFQLSLVYVLVMASTYAIVGVIVGLSGYNVQAFLQNPWVLTSIAMLFVALSLSMFGFYQLQMPSSVQTKLTQWSNKQGGGQVTGVAAMGFVSTLIVGPCVTAPLAGALIYIAKTGDALIGGTALFALGLGMGAPLLLIGASAGKLVPRAGTWMNTINHVFGILMLAMAIYMLSRFLPTTLTMSLYGILALMSGVYLGATDSTSHDSSGWQRFSKGAGIAVSLYGAILLVGALAGGSSYSTPLRALVAGNNQNSNGAKQHALPFQPVKSVDELQQLVTRAKTEGRPLMLDFYADWCISCKEMEAFTFTDDRVQNQLSNAIVVQADVTANDADDQALLKQFDLFGPPGIIFYNANGRELPAARVVGFMNAEKFSAHIQRFIGGSSAMINNSQAVASQLE